MPDQPKSVAAVVLKVLLDRLLFTPVNMAALFMFTGVVEGQSLHRIVLTAIGKPKLLRCTAPVVWCRVGTFKLPQNKQNC